MRGIVMRSTAGIVAAMLLIAGFLGIQLVSGNLHEVEPGELYRSAQLAPGDLTKYVNQYHIATVINLRGQNAHEAWYRDEVKEAAQLGVKHIDFAMKASRELTDEQAMQLIVVMRDAPKPLLIHCHSGADRTGLAAALYVAAVKKQSEWSAERQMWLNYGHIPIIGAAVAMNRTFERMEPLLGFKNS